MEKSNDFNNNINMMFSTQPDFNNINMMFSTQTDFNNINMMFSTQPDFNINMFSKQLDFIILT